MARVIHCPCGYDVRGDSDEALLAEARKHIQEAHPDRVGTISDQDLLSSAEEE